jgi:predicted HAD superfamily phosphohydrolase YqeG
MKYRSFGKWRCYLRALFDLCLGRASGWVSSVETELDYRAWVMPRSRHMFFDIDDTLNGHRKGLTPSICEWLNELSRGGKSVVLLTNCSEGRSREHQGRLEQYSCDAELWPVGAKPDHVWLRHRILERGWRVEDCAMFGDRPTMDLWMASKAGFAERIWVRAWGLRRKYHSPLSWIQGLEWLLCRAHGV